ncbi:MAG: heme biosynthesis protein HemY, partial [Pseudomonadota bacterium]
ELALAAEDFPGARRALGDLAETDPTTRSLAIRAAIEKGQGAPDIEVRAWLAKALDAPRGETWVCQVCNDVQSTWVPVCPSCGAFDSLTWTRPTETGRAATAAAMLPLIIGTLPDERDTDEATTVDVDVEASDTEERATA